MKPIIAYAVDTVIVGVGDDFGGRRMTCLLCEDIEDVLYEVGLWCPMCKEEEE